MPRSSVAKTIFDGAPFARIASASRGRSATRYALESKRRETAFTAKQNYYGLLKAEALKEVRAEALELAQVERPDLLITDYQMPFLSGLELCQRLKQLPATRQIPAIMLTARGFALEEPAMEAAGIKLCLHKPFSPREVLQMVDNLLAVTGAGNDRRCHLRQ